MARLLFVDDEENLRFLFQKVFENRDEYTISTAGSFKEAEELLADQEYDLILTDINMPGKNGIELLKDIKRMNPDAYVVIITGNPSVESAAEAVRNGAFDYLLKPFNISKLEEVIQKALFNKSSIDEKERLAKIERKYIENLELTVHQQTHEIRKAYKFLSKAHGKSLEILARAADYRDDDTGAHIIKIGVLSSVLAERLGLSGREVDLLRHAAPMHDVGKIGIPDRILQKPGKLTENEFELMKQHTVIGAKIFFDSEHPYHVASGVVALTHHERFNGSGYPRGLTGDQIHIFGRIVSVVDVFDALISERVYKPAWSEEQALEYIRSEAGGHFDPEIVSCFLENFSELRGMGKGITENELQKSVQIEQLNWSVDFDSLNDEDSEEYYYF